MAKAAGYRMGHEGGFSEWLKSKRLDGRSREAIDRLRNAWDKGAEQKIREQTAKLEAKAKKARASAKKSGMFSRIPEEYDLYKAFERGAGSLDEALDMAGAVAKNPAKWKRCVKAVGERGGANAYAVCAPLRTKKNVLALSSLASLPGVNSFGKQVQKFVKGKKSKNPRNPESSAIEMSERFHGRPVQEMVEVIEEKHYHEFLAELGILTRLKVKACNGGIVDLDFDDDETLLCSNENGSQLYIRGGDQSVDLSEFGIDLPYHDYEDLGAVKEIRYYTTKEHLGSEGGEATYFHHFGEEDIEKGLKPRLPRLIYSTRDNLLSLKGGGYTVEPEGIRN